MSSQIKICIGGIQGYVGNALVKLIYLHPHLILAGMLAKESDTEHSRSNIGYKENIPVYTINAIIENSRLIDVLLLAVPPEASIAIVSAFKNTPIKIIDLSGAFRLPLEELLQWYGITHELSELIHGAPYGSMALT